ncbi:hypothetical protein EVAR_54405_1 [Eumeta japonica]|uniref:Uncharacterized protein n=1 Tax=Eumeta variegata TaxID=151549 RepID=A0A4C1Y817_EUMVA|nr:hypothetical protein EVAR_54405_1 [Eumeta japonica]
MEGLQKDVPKELLLVVSALFPKKLEFAVATKKDNASRRCEGNIIATVRTKQYISNFISRERASEQRIQSANSLHIVMIVKYLKLRGSTAGLFGAPASSRFRAGGGAEGVAELQRPSGSFGGGVSKISQWPVCAHGRYLRRSDFTFLLP